MGHDFYYTSLSQRSSRDALGAALGANVQRFRRDQQLSISALSFISEISRPLLLKIERGQSDVRLSYVERLADALCVEPLTLLTHFEAENEQHS